MTTKKKDQGVPQQSLDGFMTIPQFARAYGFKVHAIRRAVKDGRITSYQPFGKRIYINVQDVLYYIHGCGRTMKPRGSQE